MRSEFLTVVVFLCTCAAFGQANPTKGVVVPHWFRTGNNINGVYTITADTTMMHGGKSSVSIRCDTCSTTPPPDDASESETVFGSIVQAIRPDAFRGKRISFSAYLKTANVQGEGAGLWLRIDNASWTEALDNMSDPDRMVRGTTGWKQYRVVMDVPQDAQLIAFGGLLMGKGQVWIDDANLQEVGPEVAPTADQKKFSAVIQQQMAQLTPEQRAEAQENKRQELEHVKTEPAQIQNPEFEQ